VHRRTLANALPAGFTTAPTLEMSSLTATLGFHVFGPVPGVSIKPVAWVSFRSEVAAGLTMLETLYSFA
jgi:hypothetical protein